jgi:hypothetical protein
MAWQPDGPHLEVYVRLQSYSAKKWCLNTADQNSLREAME